MSSKFFTFIFIILVSVQLSSCGWLNLLSGGKKELATEKTTEKSDEPNSSPGAAIDVDGSGWVSPKNHYVHYALSSDNNEDESLSENSPQSTITTPENVAKTSTQAFDEYSEEESSKPDNSEKEIKSIPTTSSNSTDKVVNYVSSTATQITDSSTPATGNSESESTSTDNTNTSKTTENTLNVTGNNVPRNVDDHSAYSDGTSVENSSPTSTDDIVNAENSSVGNFSEFITPEVTYAPNVKDISSWIDEEKEPTSNDQGIGRKDKETHSSRNVTDEPDYSTQKTITENYESGNSSTDTTNTPTITENTLNSTSNNEARNVIDDTENSGNSSKSETVSDLDSSASIQANTTINSILSTSTDTMNTTEMAGSMSNGTTPEVNFGSFVNSGSTGNTYSQLILNLCILIFSISVIV